MSNLLLYKILSGESHIKLNGVTYLVKGNTIIQKYLAEQYYEELVEMYSASNELKTGPQLRSWLIANKFWSVEEDEQIIKYRKDIEDFKVKIFESKFRAGEKKIAKDAIKLAKSKLNALSDRLHRFDCLTPEGSALMAKNKYLIGMSLYRKDKTPLFGDELETFLESDFPFLDNLIIEINEQLANTETIRGLARSDEWRKYWCARETESIFGKSAIELTDEQLNLISWTRVYDNIYQHPDCPDEEVIQDDDAMDGFLIADKRKRDKEKGLIGVDNLVQNEKIKRADEMFVVVNTPEDAKKIHDLNADSTKRVIEQREKLIEKHGQIDNFELPDMKNKLKLAINQRTMQLMKG